MSRIGLSGALAHLVAALAFVAMGCAGRPPLPDLEGAGPGFSGSLVEAHLETFERVGPRLAGSRADARLRAYLVRGIEAMGVRVVSGAEGPGPIVAEVAGRSPDRLMLVAPYGLVGARKGVDDAGAALLLELARVFARGPTPTYTTRIALADVRLNEPSVEAAPGSSEASVRAAVSAAAGRLAAAAGSEVGSGRLRAVITFELQARADARVARDLRSHPVFREVFWEAARRRGQASVFPADTGWTSVDGLAGPFRALAGDRVLALVDERIARAELGGPVAAGPPSASALVSIGEVTLEALGQLTRRFEKIDAFAP